MKHTECKDCELSNGDCGNHFKMDGKTNYDIASLSACDKYGNCEFFKPKLIEYRFTFGTDELNLQSYFIKALNFFEAVTEFKSMLHENKISIDSLEDVEVTEIRR